MRLIDYGTKVFSLLRISKNFSVNITNKPHHHDGVYLNLNLILKLYVTVILVNAFRVFRSEVV